MTHRKCNRQAVERFSGKSTLKFENLNSFGNCILNLETIKLNLKPVRSFIFICLICLCFTSLAQPAEPWYNTTYVNADKPGAEYRFSFIHVTDTHIGEGIGDYGSEGLLDEMPDGDIGYSAERLRTFVNWVNDHYKAEGIEFVVVSGDLTDSGERSEFLKFKEIMDVLDIPYIPLIGNHDVWPYTDDTVCTRPNGDSLINVIFEDVFDEAAAFFDRWDNGSRLTYTWNEEAERFNYLQNYAAFYKGFHFLFMDFNPRYPAARNEPGIGPEAQIMNFDGGTLQWVNNKLEQLQDLGDQNIFLVSHHPPSNDLWSFYNAFSLDEKQTIMDLLFNYKNHLAVWLAGHIHRNMVYQAKTVSLQPYNVVLCAETESNKEIEQADNTGRIILKEILAMEGTSYRFTLELRDQPKGIYHLRLKNSNGIVTQRLIIQ